MVYSQQFTGNQNVVGQCTAWGAFRTAINAGGGYTSVTIRGSNDPVGRTCLGASANTLCLGLKNQQPVNLVCGGNTWIVGSCGSDFEIGTNGGLCNCSNGHVVRPCVGNTNWGGMNGATCGAGSQTLEVICQ